MVTVSNKDCIVSFLIFLQHFLCDPGIPPPRMEVTFSMRRLSKIEDECKQYMAAIQKMHNHLQEQRESEVGLYRSAHILRSCPFNLSEKNLFKLVKLQIRQQGCC